MIHIRPIELADGTGHCDAHDRPTSGLAAWLIEQMRVRHGSGGITVCGPCIVRARDEAKTNQQLQGVQT